MGGVLLFVVGILMGGHLDHMSVAGAVLILYLAMVSAVAYTLWSVLLAHNEVSKSSNLWICQSALQCGVIGTGSWRSKPGIQCEKSDRTDSGMCGNL